MKTMKVIDLLNKKANGEKLPSEINCYNQTFYLSDGIYIAEHQVGKYFEDYFDFSSLDYEIEIIEDTPKEDKKIEKLDVVLLGQCDNWLQSTIDTDEKIRAELNPYIIEVIKENTLVMQRKINEIIDKINGE